MLTLQFRQMLTLQFFRQMLTLQQFRQMLTLQMLTFRQMLTLQFFIIIIMMAWFMRVFQQNALAPSSVYSILLQCIRPHFLSCICFFSFLFTAMHVKSLAFCVWEWRRYSIQYKKIILLRRLSPKTTQSPWNLHRGHNQIKLSLNGCAWIKKGLWQPEEDIFFVGFFFSSSSGTLRSMTIKRHGHLCPKRITSLQLVINPATYTSDCDSTSSGRHNLHHGNINLT